MRTNRKLFDDKPDFWEYLKIRLEVAWLLVQLFIAITVTLKLGEWDIIGTLRGFLS